MIRKFSLRFWLLLSTMAAALILAGCGGGSSSSPGADDPDEPGGSTQSVSGTAAAGAPLVGFVGARDALGETETAQIGADGSFSIDVTNLQPPVLLFASGISGGNAYQLLSVATANDIGNTVNITPFTDLIVGNTLGKDPVTAFNESRGDANQRAALFAALDEETIGQQEALLAARLRPLLTALGIDEDFDLLNSSFSADRTGFDAVLDVVEVQVNVTSNSATIRNRLQPDSQISNTFDNTDEETAAIEVDEQILADGVTIAQAADTLVSTVATALDNNDRGTLEPLLADDFLNNGESATEWLDRLLGTEDAGELADDLRGWSLVNIESDAVNLNVGAATGFWQAIEVDGELKLRGNQAQFLAYSEATHIVENGANPPVVQAIATSLFASNPVTALGTVDTSTVSVSGPEGTPFNGTLTRGDNLFSTFFVIESNDLDQIQTGDEYTFTWTGDSTAESTYRVRRGEPRLTEGAPEITSASVDLGSNQYTFEWTLPPGYESVSVRNNFTGQSQGGTGDNDIPVFTGNPLPNEDRTFTGSLPDGFSPQASNELRIIARDPYGVFVAARLVNPFADQIAPPADEDALVGSWIARNPDSDLPWVQLTFLESGYYMHQELDLPYRPEEDDAGFAGLEFGQYSWNNVTGELTVPNILIDDNRFWGLTDIWNGSEQLVLEVNGDTMTAFNPDVGPSQSTIFARVPSNQTGITGSWLIQDPDDASNVSVVTLLDDGYYFMGTSQPADESGEPGLEFGSFTYDSDTLLLEPNVLVDQNGEFGLSDPIRGFDYATVIDGALVIDDGEVFQLSEIAAGVAPSDGSLTVAYTAPDNSGDDGSTGSGAVVTGDFHYLRSVSYLEGQREGTAPTVGQQTYYQSGAALTNNGDGTGALNWSQVCVADLLVDANTDPFSGEPAVFDAVSECMPQSPGSIDNLAYTASGLSANLPAETVTDSEDGSQIRMGAASLEMTAVDSSRSLFIGQTVRDFAYEEPNSFTDGIEISADILSRKTTGRRVAELEGTWGLVIRRITDIGSEPNELEYSASSLILDVTATGDVTRVSELDRNVIQGLVADNSFVAFEKPAEVTTQQPLGPMTITDDGILSFLGGEFGGVLSADADVLFLALMNPIEPLNEQNFVSESEWITGVRLSDTFSSADLEGKEYAVISQSYWLQPNFFEVDYLEPGATLSFPVGGNPATLSRATTFAYVEFINNLPLIREGDPEATDTFQYSVSTNGRITMSSDFGEPGVVDLELNGFATPDGRLLVFETTLIADSDDGTTQEGGVGITYAICTNCD